MRTFKIHFERTEHDGLPETIMTIGFCSNPQNLPSPNTEIVREVTDYLRQNPPQGGGLLKITGPASLPVACAITHATCHIFAAVAVFDPKMQGFVVSISHDPKWSVGDLLAD